MLDQDEKGTHLMRTPGGPQELLICSEPGLYKLIARSRRPEAREFDRFVRHEILPTIRRTGRYEVDATATRVQVRRGGCCRTINDATNGSVVLAFDTLGPLCQWSRHWHLCHNTAPLLLVDHHAK